MIFLLLVVKKSASVIDRDWFVKKGHEIEWISIPLINSWIEEWIRARVKKEWRDGNRDLNVH